MSLSCRVLFPVRWTHVVDQNNVRNVHVPVHGYEPEIKHTVLVVSWCWKFVNKLMCSSDPISHLAHEGLFKMFSIRHLLLPTVCLDVGLYFYVDPLCGNNTILLTKKIPSSLIVLQYVLLIPQHDYQQHHAQGPQSLKRASHKFSPYPPYSGSKSHHQGGAGKKYAGKYPSSLEGASSSGSYTGMFKSSKPVNLANRTVESTCTLYTVGAIAFL